VRGKTETGWKWEVKEGKERKSQRIGKYLLDSRPGLSKAAMIQESSTSTKGRAAPSQDPTTGKREKVTWPEGGGNQVDDGKIGLSKKGWKIQGGIEPARSEGI